jgi:hypothetical protein
MHEFRLQYINSIGMWKILDIDDFCYGDFFSEKQGLEALANLRKRKTPQDVSIKTFLNLIDELNPDACDEERDWNSCCGCRSDFESGFYSAVSKMKKFFA